MFKKQNIVGSSSLDALKNPRGKNGKKRLYLAVTVLVAVLASASFIVTVTSNDSSADTPYTDTNGVEYLLNEITQEATIVGYTGGSDVLNLTTDPLVYNGDTYDITAVSAGALSAAYQLKEVYLPATITDIGDNAFAGCTALTTIEMPGVITIGDNAFFGDADIVNVTMPHVVTIGDSAFRGTTSLLDVDIPDATTIGNYAFYYAGVTTINAASVITIGDAAFQGDLNLIEINIPDATAIGNLAFADSKLALVTLNSISTIGNSAFRGCDLESIYIPGTITDIKTSAFDGCAKLESITIGGGSAAYISDQGALYNAGGTELIIFPAGKEGSFYTLGTTTTIREGAFEGSMIENVRLQGNITSVGPYTFSGSTKLKSIELGSVTTIGTYAFYRCFSLESINISNVTTVGASAFRNSGLTSIGLPPGINLGPNVFADSNVGSVSIYDTASGAPVGVDGTTFAGSNLSSLTVINSDGSGPIINSSGFNWTYGGHSIGTLIVNSSANLSGMVSAFSPVSGKFILLGRHTTNTPSGTYDFLDVNSVPITVPADRASTRYQGDGTNWIFKNKIYTITYDIVTNFTPEGTETIPGSNPPDSTVSSGDFVLLPSYAREKYYIVWYYNDGSGDIVFPPSTQINRDYNLVAKWEAKMFLITVVASPGTGGTVTAAYTSTPTVTHTGSYNFDYGANIELVATAAPGYKFIRWDGESSMTQGPVGTATDHVNVPGVRTYTALFQPYYVVTFDYGGTSTTADYLGASTSPPLAADQFVAHKPTDPIKADLGIFSGWYSSSTSPTTPIADSATFTANTTLYAKWRVTVTYDVNGGTAVATNPNTSAFEGSAFGIIRPADPTKTGLTFYGWYDGTTGYNNATTLNADVTLKAKWVATVTFDTNGGTPSSIPSATNVEEGTAFSVIEPTTPLSKTGLTFDGWYNGTTKYLGTTAINETVTLNAKWVATVTFDTNGGTPSSILPATNVEEGTAFSTITPSPDPSNGTATFVGWYDSNPVVNTSVRYIGTTVITADVTLYAQYGVRVTFDTNGGTPATFDEIVTSGDLFSNVKPAVGDVTKTDLDLAGWFIGATEVLDGQVISSDITVKAKWTATISFDVNGATTPTSIPNVTDVEEGTLFSVITPATIPNKTGYTFNGWWDSTTKYLPGTQITKTVTLTAMWGITVSFDTNGGTPPIIAPVSVASGTALGASMPTGLTKTGLTFDGWYNGPDLYTASTVIYTDTLLTARWTATVSFALNGGSYGGTLNPETVIENSLFGAITPSPNPNRTDLTFAGWFDDSIATPPKYDGTTAITKTVTLTAHWEATVSFDTNGGLPTSVPAVGNVTYNTPFINIKPATNPTKNGLTFDGWYDGTTKYLDTTAVIKTVTLSAKWVATVTFDINGGTPTIPPATNVVEGAAFSTVKPSDPTNVPLDFAGWFDNSVNPGVKYTDLTAITKDVTLTAGWGYIVSFNTDGGLPTSIPSVTVAAGLSLGPDLPAAPTKSGFGFVGWFDGSTPYSSATPIIGTVTLVAHWSAKVVFVTNGGLPSAIPYVTVSGGETFGSIKPADPVKGNSTFVGWYDILTDAQYNNTTVITGAVVLVAKWHEAVTFDLRGGTYIGTLAPVTGLDDGVLFGSPLVKPASQPTKAGLTFAGWWDKSVNPAVEYIDTTEISKTVTLTAKWVATVSFNTDGGIPATIPSVTNVEDGTVLFFIKPSDPTLGGRTFQGWYDGAVRYNDTTAITGDVVLKASWGTGTVSPPDRYVIVSISDAHSSIVPAGILTFFSGDNATYTYSADRGYTLEVYVNGSYDAVASSTGSYTFSGVYRNNTIEVKGTLGGGGGSGNPTGGYLYVDVNGQGDVLYSLDGNAFLLYTGPVPLTRGFTIDLLASPDHGYYFDRWSGFVQSTVSEISVSESTGVRSADGNVHISADFQGTGTSGDDGHGQSWWWILLVIILIIAVVVLSWLYYRERKNNEEDRTG
jgi:uncharacterized repeat protein (TIGR02543 family)